MILGEIHIISGFIGMKIFAKNIEKTLLKFYNV